ncbi:MAG: hypothetical protein Q7T82_05915 [Armatimonadota bacterium]|nr:hypothetical protein [Armatimonadota bacterium]
MLVMANDWLSKWKGKLNTDDDCVRFVDDLGFCTIDPAERFPEFPNQADAMGIESAIGRTWWWKDDLHIQKKLYYTRLFFNRPGYISMEMLPAFIATNGQVADELILMGRMPLAQQAIYETLEAQGPISSRELRNLLVGDVKKQSASALIALERVFIATKVDITGRTMHTYSYVWDLAERWILWAFEEADRLGVKRAKQMILEKLRRGGVSDGPRIMAAACGWQ